MAFSATISVMIFVINANLLILCYLEESKSHGFGMKKKSIFLDEVPGTAASSGCLFKHIQHYIF